MSNPVIGTTLEQAMWLVIDYGHRNGCATLDDAVTMMDNDWDDLDDQDRSAITLVKKTYYDKH